MGNQSTSNPRRRRRSRICAVVWFLSLGTWLSSGCARAQANSPVFLPGGLAYGPQGDLFLAETGRHAVLRLTPQGVVTVLAGNGTQGFSGDLGPAVAASLDSPTAIAVNGAGDVFIADAHNHRIRRVDATTSQITTFAGTGLAASGPEGGLATATPLDLPSALAFDAAGNLLFADARTHLVRRIDHATGRVTTVAGDGRQGVQGDGGKALQASLDSPSGLATDAAGDVFVSDSHNDRIRRVDSVTGVISSVAATGVHRPQGLAVDKVGNIFIADAENHRIRRIDAVTGDLTILAGDGVQQFAGDEGLAIAASLNEPGAITLSPNGLVTISDRHNDRMRQIDAAAIIHTLAGTGVGSPPGLTVSGPASVVYGTGTVTATLAGTPATGSVSFADGLIPLGSAPLIGNAAVFSVSGVSAGGHSFTASYSGDAGHGSAKSGVLVIMVTPAPLLAVANAVALVYGEPVPPLAATFSGVLARDTNAVGLSLSTAAVALSSPGLYPITGVLSGAAAGNYTLSLGASAVTISRAPALVSMNSTLAVHVAPAVAGVTTGQVNLLDGGSLYATSPLSPVGDAQFNANGLSNGSHTLSAAYVGDTNFLSAVSQPITLAIGPVPAVDFTLASLGPSSATVSSGSAATFSFAIGQVNGQLASPVTLAVSGLPPGATASFNPAYLPPGSAPSSFDLTVKTQMTTGFLRTSNGSLFFLAALLPLFAIFRRRRVRIYPLSLLLLIMGCGDRINTAGSGASPSRTFNITVNATATSTSGISLQHSAVVTLNVQ